MEKLNNIKLIITDLDGTVLEHGKVCSTDDLDAFQQAINNNIHVTIATGQGYSGCVINSDKLGLANSIDWAVMSNGAVVSKKSTYDPLHISSIDSDIVKMMLNKFTELDICAIVFNDVPSHVYWNQVPLRCESMNERKWFDKYTKTPIDDINSFNFDTPIQIMIFVEYEKQEIVEQWFKENNLDNVLTSMQNNIESIPIYEFTNLEATKGNAILKLIKELNIDVNEVVIFGDNMNDMSMFELIPNSVAMGNAVPAIKKAAKFVTDTNKNGGVGKFIREYIL